MDKNRYANATAAEKATFTKVAKILKENLTHTAEKSRELKGKAKVKYIFVLKGNNPLIHTLEFGVKDKEIVNIRLVVSRTTLKTDFYKGIMKSKSDPKSSYGGIVIHFNTDEKGASKILMEINTLCEDSEEVELDPKRTYSDPPQGWSGCIGNGKPVKEEEVPTPEPVLEEV